MTDAEKEHLEKRARGLTCSYRGQKQLPFLLIQGIGCSSGQCQQEQGLTLRVPSPFAVGRRALPPASDLQRGLSLLLRPTPYSFDLEVDFPCVPLARAD